MQCELMYFTVFRCSCHYLCVSNSQTTALITDEQSLLGAYDFFFFFLAMLQIFRFVLFFAPLTQLGMSDNYGIPISIALSHKMQGVSVIYGSPLSAGIKTVQA